MTVLGYLLSLWFNLEILILNQMIWILGLTTADLEFLFLTFRNSKSGAGYKSSSFDDYLIITRKGVK